MKTFVVLDDVSSKAYKTKTNNYFTSSDPHHDISKQPG